MKLGFKLVKNIQGSQHLVPFDLDTGQILDAGGVGLSEEDAKRIRQEEESRPWRPAFSPVREEPNPQAWYCQIPGCGASGDSDESRTDHLKYSQQQHHELLEANFRAEARRRHIAKTDPSGFRRMINRIVGGSEATIWTNENGSNEPEIVTCPCCKKEFDLGKVKR